MMINVFTLFPSMFRNFLSESIVEKAITTENIKVKLVDIRDYSHNKHGKVDDYPYGGGAGMVMSAQPIVSALKYHQAQSHPIIYFTPHGRKLTQAIVKEYQEVPEFSIICGHYKDIDQRVRDKYVTDEISVGDFVLSGGELPAMIMIDAIARLFDGVLNDIESAETDSFQKNRLGFPCYTRPAEFEGMKVPDVLMSGNHAKIEKWHEEESKRLTKERRPDLLDEK